MEDQGIRKATFEELREGFNRQTEIEMEAAHNRLIDAWSKGDLSCCGGYLSPHDTQTTIDSVQAESIFLIPPVYTLFRAEAAEYGQETSCECGAQAVMSSHHSSYCPKHTKGTNT